MDLSAEGFQQAPQEKQSPPSLADQIHGKATDFVQDVRTKHEAGELDDDIIYEERRDGSLRIQKTLADGGEFGMKEAVQVLLQENRTKNEKPYVEITRKLMLPRGILREQVVHLKEEQVEVVGGRRIDLRTFPPVRRKIHHTHEWRTTRIDDTQRKKEDDYSYWLPSDKTPKTNDGKLRLVDSMLAQFVEHEKFPYDY